jgi:hypothetical protein
LAAAALLAACASVPHGPSVMVLPGTGKSFDQFQTDDWVCRQWASQQTGGATTQKAATETTVTGAAIGTAVGAAVGAAIGAAAGSAATGAAVGAGVGLTGGTIGGASAAEGTVRAIQRRYDIAYMQCMYAKGHRVPVARGSEPAYRSTGATAPTPAATATIPPPPAGAPPPPPPGPAR